MVKNILIRSKKYRIMILSGANMVYTFNELKIKYKEYSNIKTKVSRLVAKGDLISLKNGLYTDENKNPLVFAEKIYGPSYISFETALSIYNLIPERVYKITSATFNKRKSKQYVNKCGTYIYKDVPKSVFHLDIVTMGSGEEAFLIASKEKALLDMLYSLPPIHSKKNLIVTLFNDLRIDVDEFKKLDFKKMRALCALYCTSIHKQMYGFLGGLIGD